MNLRTRLTITLVRIKMWLSHIKSVWKRYRVNPMPGPESIGNHKPKSWGHRAIGLELGFKLHADGSVDQIRRNGRNERVSDEHLIGAVHREYKDIVDAARKKHRIRY